MTVRDIGDPLAAFSCPKCGALSLEPSLKWEKGLPGDEHIVIRCDDCGYSEWRPTKDALPTEPTP